MGFIKDLKETIEWGRGSSSLESSPETKVAVIRARKEMFGGGREEKRFFKRVVGDFSQKLDDDILDKSSNPVITRLRESWPNTWGEKEEFKRFISAEAKRVNFKVVRQGYNAEEYPQIVLDALFEHFDQLTEKRPEDERLNKSGFAKTPDTTLCKSVLAIREVESNAKMAKNESKLREKTLENRNRGLKFLADLGFPEERINSDFKTEQNGHVRRSFEQKGKSVTIKLPQIVEDTIIPLDHDALVQITYFESVRTGDGVGATFEHGSHINISVLNDHIYDCWLTSGSDEGAASQGVRFANGTHQLLENSEKQKVEAYLSKIGIKRDLGQIDEARIKLFIQSALNLKNATIDGNVN